MPLKSKKTATPVEMYKARKQREEEEKGALLPPGLINHGNTCFMNSVLQGLIATPILADIVRFQLPATYLPISSRRSPQLTNGHGRGAQWEREWEQGMPLGDVFIRVMDQAWKLQDEHERLSMSPKEILTKLGAKYDQYLDFRQQDAHELLRHLLDAMRMEEWDIIKKRQPPPSKGKRKGLDKDVEAVLPGMEPSSATAATSSPQLQADINGSSSRNDEPQPQKLAKPIPEEDRLISFVDMVFGGQLASILVCEKCKKVSCTYEDFNDLSLSIKPEDYEKVRRRDKLKSLAKKLKRRTGVDFGGGHRASSVPASPTKKSLDLDRVLERAIEAEPRRRSLDIDEEKSALDDSESVSGEMETEIVASQSMPIPAPAPAKEEEEDEGATVTSHDPPDAQEASKDDKRLKVKAKSQDDDGWAKLGRRISIGMGLKKEKGRSKSGVGTRRREKEVEKEKAKDGGQNTASVTVPPVDILEIKAPIPTSAHVANLATLAASTSPPLGDADATTPQQSGLPAHFSPALIASPSSSPRLSPIPRPASIVQPKHNPSPSPSRAKSPRPPKPSREKAAYLRRILADVPSTSPAPFTMFRGNLGSPSPDSNAVTTLWAKLGNVRSIEDCLRMFTAVEALDGENMVGCRRCWKIEQGVYKPRGRSTETEKAIGERDDDESSDSSEDELDVKKVPDYGSSHPPYPDLNVTSPATTATTDGNSPSASSLELDEGVESRQPTPLKDVVTSPPQLAIYSGYPIPLISTTAPESPLPRGVVSANSNTPVPHFSTDSPDEVIRGSQIAHTADDPLFTSPSIDSLTLPLQRHPGRRRVERKIVAVANGESSSASSDESADDLESDTSMTTSLCSELSSVTSPSVRPPTHPVAPLSAPRSKSPFKSDIPRSKQVIFRRSYKRYLLSSPPPVLVIHLKRFQQVGKSPVQFFANFKKLDDVVSFPEYLDLKPFLLPMKEDFGLRKKTKKIYQNFIDSADKSSAKEDEKCMYRLYAVVVHIGNMLGGHYIAYTALPENVPELPRAASALAETPSPFLGTDAKPCNPRTASFESSVDVKGKHPLHTPRQWCYISDTVVRLTTLEEVMKAKAYICLYERL